MWFVVFTILLLWLVLWSLGKVSKDKEPEVRLHADDAITRDEESALTLSFSVESIRPQPMTPEQQAVYDEERKAWWDEIIRNAVPWCDDETIKLPIKSLTQRQYYCLRGARLRFIVVPESDQINPKFEGSDRLSVHPMRTISSLLKHGMLAAVGDSSYKITDVGLRALQCLPVSYR